MKIKIEMKLLIVISLFLFTLNLSAQQDWSKMSANQKVKLAKKEQKAAKKDPEYLKIMDEALSLFQEGKFDEAKEKYTAAHNKRPDNVYPMVMLDDIEVAMNLPQEEVNEILVEESTEELIVEPEVIPSEEQVEPELETEIVISEPEVEEVIPEPIAIPVATEIKISEENKAITKTTETAKETTPLEREYLDDGVYRESLKEGNAQVDQITIVEKDVQTVYRKVSHAWGATYYFKNGDSIFESEWDKVLEGIEKD